uniref:Uncharacterized protein n=1 Tax=Amphiprion percula TaxID=161767 RepID=A0A3P8RJ14_AMPPE
VRVGDDSRILHVLSCGDGEHGGLDAAGGGSVPVAGGCPGPAGSGQAAVLQRGAGAHGQEAVVVVSKHGASVLPTSLQPSGQ